MTANAPLWTDDPPDGLSDTERDAILARRAERLAMPADSDVPGDVVDVLTFQLGTERYAIPSGQVNGVVKTGHLTALPGAPSFVAGLVNVHGQVVTVIDLRPLLQLPTDDVARAVILVSGQGGDVGLLATAIPSIEQVDAQEFAPLPTGLPSILDPRSVLGICSDMTIVIDAAHLLADGRLLVDQEG